MCTVFDLQKLHYARPYVKSKSLKYVQAKGVHAVYQVLTIWACNLSDLHVITWNNCKGCVLIEAILIEAISSKVR